MTNSATLQLLRQLGSGTLPPGVESAPKVLGSQGVDFAQLLQQAQAGTLTSKLPVSVDPDSGVVLNDAQLAALGFAADKAEAQGVRTALVTMDNQRFILDVHSRRVSSAAQVQSLDGDGPTRTGAGILAGIDGVIDLDGIIQGAGAQDKSLGNTQGLGALGNGSTSSASIIKLLSSLSKSA